jgi:hypothetical protein
MRNPKRAQIVRDPRRIIECKVFVELQPVRGTWNSQHCHQPIKKTRSGNKAAEKVMQMID